MSASSEPHVLPDLNSGPRNFCHDGSGPWRDCAYDLHAYGDVGGAVSGPFGLDDIVCSVATDFGLVQIMVSAAAISFGFGKALVLLTPSQIASAEKAVYVALLLYIVTSTLTKCTVALLLAHNVFLKSRVQACYGIIVSSCIWGFASSLAEAIRCTAYIPWKLIGDQCADLLLSWQAITDCNILIEIALLALPVWLVWGLQTGLAGKVTVVIVFWLRIPVTIAAGLRI
ncbi:hypothetical protein DOTSEDRAFT_29402 [Dothistroma septosporum NZE10]|uniref:Rhodopsin domain-containing protein n=1 Tax=Dothistroma septosporum (strain NZE10 / CBS 128990) TaxID=675120 RepID=N1PC40_DOTSN|nr:hypothetical protein DOTSEDRAFT_29402 [Dothistroma septosporum NZE10]